MPDLTEDDLPRYAPAPTRNMRGLTEEDLPRYAPSSVKDTVEHGGRPVVNLYVPKGEAAGRGALDAATFGTAPVISGLSAAGATAPEPLPMVGEFPGLEIPAYGAAKLSRGDEAAKAAYEQERADMAAKRAASFEQHPGYTLGGELAGGLVTPGFGGMTAATLPGRIGGGIAAGAVGGGVYGAGSAVGEGGGAQEALRGAAEGAGFGAATGGVFGGAFGPRVRAPNGALERAAQTAEELGAPLPRGLVSPSRGVQQITAATRSLPGVGPQIGAAVHRTEQAAGQRIENIAGGMTRAGAGRDVADEAVRSGLQSVIDRNKADIDALYSAVRAKVHPSTPIDLPQTATALQNVIARRAAKKQINPQQGLEQVINAAKDPAGITMEGARGLRQDLREAGDVLNPHPGYNDADFNRLTQALSGDLKVAAHRLGAGKEFDAAESRFKVLAEHNRQLAKMVRAPGETAIGKAIGAAREKGGYVRMLQQMRQSMPPEYFEHIGGQILHELGSASATGDFSLSRFVTGWNKLSRPAKEALFSPEHLRDINNIVGMGEQIKGSLAVSHANTSHTATPIIMFDIAERVVESVAEGHFIGAAGVVGSGAAGAMLARWLASPAKASAMRAWGDAYQNMQQRSTPVRSATFNFATRRLAHTLGIPVDRILSTAGIAVDASERSNQ